MKTRVDAGTDIAMIGAWDASRNDPSLANVDSCDCAKAVEADAAAGHLFLIHTGGDGGGPVDVFLDSEIPEDLRKQSRALKGEFLLSLPTGRLVVGGAEDYRSRKPRITNQDSVVTVPAGNYSVRCRAGTREGGINPPSRAELESAMGVDDYRYHRRIQNAAVTAYFAVPVVFVVLAACLGWKSALGLSTILGAILYLIFKLWTHGNERFKRASQVEQDCWHKGMEREAPTLILELHKASDTAGLKGGSTRL